MLVATAGSATIPLPNPCQNPDTYQPPVWALSDVLYRKLYEYNMQYGAANFTVTDAANGWDFQCGVSQFGRDAISPDYPIDHPEDTLTYDCYFRGGNSSSVDILGGSNDQKIGHVTTEYIFFQAQNKVQVFQAWVCRKPDGTYPYVIPP